LHIEHVRGTDIVVGEQMCARERKRDIDASKS
jgi:hypothetical protein